MEFRLLGWAPGPKLRLDHEVFAYAGKFVLPSGKAVVTDGPDKLHIPDPQEGYTKGVLAAAAFSDDRADGSLWIRYISVRAEMRGEALGARLCAFVRERAVKQGYETVRIAVNNPYAYEALYKSGFGFTGRETGLAELVLEHPAPDDRSSGRYHEGLSRFADRELSPGEDVFLSQRTEPPSAVVAPNPKRSYPSSY
jgi:GNAT superfamily N-acetyltransferase